MLSSETHRTWNVFDLNRFDSSGLRRLSKAATVVRVVVQVDDSVARSDYEGVVPAVCVARNVHEIRSTPVSLGAEVATAECRNPGTLWA